MVLVAEVGFVSSYGRPLSARRFVRVVNDPLMSQTVETEVAEDHYEPDCSPEQVELVVSALDRWSGRTSKHVTHLRSSERHDYRTTVTIESNEPLIGDTTLRQVFHVPTRNVSKAGLGIVAPPVFLPRLLSDATPLMRAEAIFRVGAKIKVTLGPPTGIMPTLNAEITRRRPIYFGFFDVGVRFVAREDEAIGG